MKITLVKDGVKALHNLPDEWDDVPMKAYIRIQQIIKEDIKDLEKIVKIIRVLTDIPEKDVYRLPVSNIQALGGVVSDLLKTEPNDELKPIIKIDNVEYGFIPKLQDITFGEWVDIDTLLTGDINNNLHKIMSILYRPVVAKDGDKYAIQDYEPCKEREQVLLNNLTVGDFNGASVFFSDLGRELLHHTLKSSVTALKENITDKKQQLYRNGAGTQSYID